MEENENEIVMDGKTKLSKKTIKTIIAIVVAIIAIVVLVNIFSSSPEKTVKSFLKNLNAKKVSKAMDSFDMVGFAAFTECKGDYEDFKDNYKDAKEEYEEDKDEAKEAIEKMTDTIKDKLDDYDEFSIEIKDIGKAKKVSKAKDLYKVKAKIKTTIKEDGDKDKNTSTIEFYVYKNKIVGMDTKSGSGLKLFY